MNEKEREEVVIDPEVRLPHGLRPITLTVEEEAQIRLLLNDPNQPTFAGNDLPKAMHVDSEAN
jgi:hypothetical protein